MGQKGVGNSVNRKLLKIANKNGGRIVWGKKHIKVFDGKVLVAVLSRGGHSHDDKAVMTAFRRRGWV